MFDWKYPGYMLVLIVFGSLVASHIHAQNLYRYANDEGITVLDDYIPPEYVGKGYEVLSKSGRLLKVVPAHADKPLGATQEQKNADEARQREDKYILASYRSREEIRHTRERKLQLLEREIHIVEGNLDDTQTQRARERARAANYQRGGRVVPKTVKTVLVELDDEEGKALSMLKSRRQEHADVKALYDKYEARFVELTGEGSVASSVSQEIMGAVKN